MRAIKLVELRDMQSVDIRTADSGEYLLNMVYSEDVSELNFREFRIEEFRSGFLLGEVILL